MRVPRLTTRKRQTLLPGVLKRAFAITLVLPTGTSGYLLIRPTALATAYPNEAGHAMVRGNAKHDISAPLKSLAPSEPADLDVVPIQNPSPSPTPPDMTSPPGARAIEQTKQGNRPSATVVANFDGLGAGFKGPQGTAILRNPSDNSLAVGPNHIFQIVNTRIAIFTKQGKQFQSTGEVVYGPVRTNTIFKGFGGACENINNGDAVVRYDQLADRWLVVMPTFRRGPARPDQPKPGRDGDPAQLSVPGKAEQPGAATALFKPSPEMAQTPQPRGQATPTPSAGPYSMCYAVSTSSDPLGSYYRYEFLRALFPDYPRPAVWPD